MSVLTATEKLRRINTERQIQPDGCVTILGYPCILGVLILLGDRQSGWRTGKIHSSSHKWTLLSIDLPGCSGDVCLYIHYSVPTTWSENTSYIICNTEFRSSTALPLPSAAVLQFLLKWGEGANKGGGAEKPWWRAMAAYPHIRHIFPKFAFQGVLVYDSWCVKSNWSNKLAPQGLLGTCKGQLTEGEILSLFESNKGYPLPPSLLPAPLFLEFEYVTLIFPFNFPPEDKNGLPHPHPYLF